MTIEPMIRSLKKVWHETRTATFLVIVVISSVVVPTSSYAQINPNQTQSSSGSDSKIHSVESGGPDYLNPVSNTADLNMLAGIFGNIARAAAGQIDLADILVEEGATGGVAEGTDSVLSAMMYIYLMGIMGITGFVIVLLIAAMAAQAGIEGKVLTERYNEWAAIRTIYAVFAMLPVLGGWSIGQYAILNGTFYVNSITNEMNHIGNRWVFARGSTNSIDLDPYEYRRIVETVYLNEICAQIANKGLHDWKAKQDAYIDGITHRLQSGMLSEEAASQLTKGAYWIKSRLDTEMLTSRLIQGSFDQNITAKDRTQFNYTHKAYSPITSQRGENLIAIYRWGSPETSINSCGEVQIDYGTFVNANDGMSQRTLNAYYLSQRDALENLTAQAEADIANVYSKVNEINGQSSPIDKISRETLLRDEAESDFIFNAFAKAFDDLAPMSVTSIDKLFALRVSEYRSTVSEAYKNETANYAKLFDELLNELAKRQREGGRANYNEMYKNAELDLDPKFASIAGPEVRSLIENTSKGWIYGGFKWWDLSRSLTNQLALQTNIPDARSYTRFLTGISSSNVERIENFTNTYNFAKASRQLKDMKLVADGNVINATPLNEDFAEGHAKSGEPKEALNNFRIGFGSWLTQSLTATFFKDFQSTDLLSNIQSAGHKYLWIGDSLLVTAAALNITSQVADTGGGWAIKLTTLGGSEVAGSFAAAVFKSMAGIMVWGAYLLLAIGFLYAVYLPLLPAMIWTFGIIGWLEKLISLIIMFPLWMFGHIFPGGDGLINGIGRQGYVLTANVLFRPPVMLLSLHFSMAALGAIGFFIGDFVEVFVPSANGDYTTGLTTGIFGFIVMSGFIVVIVHMVLAWIYKIPDELGHYIGGSGSNFGESEGRSHANQISGIISNQTQSLHSMNGGGSRDPNQRPKKSKGGSGNTKQNTRFGSMAV